MMRIRNFAGLAAAFVVGAATLVTPNSSRAAFSVQVYDDGVLTGITGTVVNNQLVLFGGSTTNFSISAGNVTSNFPGTQGGSTLALSSNETIGTTFGAAGGTHTIKIVVSETGFTAPAGTTLALSSSGGGSIGYVVGATPGASDSVTSTYQAYLDNSNTLAGQPAAAGTPVQTASASLSALGTAPLVYSPGVAINPTVPGGTPFSMTDVLSFTFTLAAGSGQDTANASFTTVAGTPEPSSLAAVFSGVPIVGLGLMLRRRRRTA